MMRVLILLSLISLTLSGVVTAQKKQSSSIPRTLFFAGMRLTLDREVRNEIQEKVEKLKANPKYFMAKVELARMYFPIIEQIFKTEDLPDDFKYLALQESGLESDAVSSSQAVGYWQFKDFTAREMGLRVDKEIDERMNIVSSTQAAARYLIRNNNTYFDNWVHALQSYQMGATGAQEAISRIRRGAKTMHITKSTYWYVKSYLAHKVAFEGMTDGKSKTPLSIRSFSSVSTKKVARELGMREQDVKFWNKWILTDYIPKERKYFVLYPFDRKTSNIKKQVLAKRKKTPSDTTSIDPSKSSFEETWRVLPPIDDYKLSVTQGPFFDKPLRNRGEEATTVALVGESWWDISRRTGVRLKNLKKYNPNIRVLSPGLLIHLRGSFGLHSLGLFKRKRSAWNKIDSLPSFDKKPDTSTRIMSKDTPLKTRKDQVEKPRPKQTKRKTKTPVHIVTEQETLYMIARKYHVTVEELMQWNQLQNSVIQIGQKLFLGSPFSSDTSETKNLKEAVLFHEVVEGDTIFSVARQYSVTVKNLMKWNDKQDMMISVGDRLKILKE